MESFKYGFDINFKQKGDINFKISKNVAGKLIGKGGETITKIRNNRDGNILILGKHCRRIVIYGNDNFKIFGDVLKIIG